MVKRPGDIPKTDGNLLVSNIDSNAILLLGLVKCLSLEKEFSENTVISAQDTRAGDNVNLSDLGGDRANPYLRVRDSVYSVPTAAWVLSRVTRSNRPLKNMVVVFPGYDGRQINCTAL